MCTALFLGEKLYVKLRIHQRYVIHFNEWFRSKQTKAVIHAPLLANKLIAAITVECKLGMNSCCQKKKLQMRWIIPLFYHSTEQSLFIKILTLRFSFWLKFEAILQLRWPFHWRNSHLTWRNAIWNYWAHPIISNTANFNNNWFMKWLKYV